MKPQDQQPLLFGDLSSSTGWPGQNIIPGTQNNIPGTPTVAASQHQQQQSAFASASSGFHPQLLQQTSGQVQQNGVQTGSLDPFQQASTAPCPIPGNNSTRQDHHHQHQQHQGACPEPTVPNRYCSYGSSSQQSDGTLHSYSTAGNASELYSSFDSMSLSSRTAPTKRYNSSGSTDTVDVLSQRYPSCSSVGAGAAAADALPCSLGQSSCYYPPAPQSSAEQQQQVLFSQCQQQQQPPLRYPSIDSTASGRSSSWGPSTVRLHGISSSRKRADSISSSTSSNGRYPSLPAPHSSGFASRAGSGVSDGAHPTNLLHSWDSGDCVHQQQPQQMHAQTDQQQQQQQQQQHRPSFRERLRHPLRSSGLYPILSCEASHQQQERKKVQQGAPWGYDLQVQLQQVSGLPSIADPYVMVLVHLAGHDEEYRTEPQWGTQQAVYGPDEAFDLANVQPGCTLRCEVWDKNALSKDEMIGRATWSLEHPLKGASRAHDSRQVPPAAAAADAAADADAAPRDQECPWSAASDVTLELRHPTKSPRATGILIMQVSWRPSDQEGQPRRVGPVRFRQHYCRTAGLFTGQWSTDETMCYSTYKLFLCHISSVFQGVKMPWNRQYDKARWIFETPGVVPIIKQQHSAMYATQAGPSRGGVLRCAGDFFRLFNYGLRGGQARFFTYVLCSDSLRCSETGTDFGTDIVSKHAMHAGGAEEVLYAGEFCIMRCESAPDGHKLVLDNNSGTYSPYKAELRRLQQLFIENFPGMVVEVLDWRDPKLGYYQSLCPSRGGAAAAPAPAAPAAAAVTTPRWRGQQFVAG